MYGLVLPKDLFTLRLRNVFIENRDTFPLPVINLQKISHLKVIINLNNSEMFNSIYN